MGAWHSLPRWEILLFCGEHPHPIEDHGGWNPVLPVKGRRLVIADWTLPACMRLPVTLHLGPTGDRQSKHGQQSLAALPNSCGRVKVLPLPLPHWQLGTSYLLLKGRYYPGTRPLEGLGLKPSNKHFLPPST